MTAKAVMKEASIAGIQLSLDGDKLAMKAGQAKIIELPKGRVRR
jgi:hypothetical protein